MNRSLEAFLRGYLFFRVNGQYFALYNNALKRRKALIVGDVNFIGWHVWKGWIGFYIRAGAYAMEVDDEHA